MSEGRPGQRSRSLSRRRAGMCAASFACVVSALTACWVNQDLGWNDAPGPAAGGSHGTEGTSADGASGACTARDLPPESAPAAFVHPGILVSREQLDFVKAKVADGLDPWAGQVSYAATTTSGALPYHPQAVPLVECAGGHSQDDVCKGGAVDALAAYTKALLWYYTADGGQAADALAIVRAWSSTLQDVTSDANDKSQTGPLHAAWMGELFPRAAEILRTNESTGWTDTDTANLVTMLRRALLPHVVNGWQGAGYDWPLAMADATVNIGVFSDDRATFEKGIALWRAYMMADIYLTGDGPEPATPPGVADACGAWPTTALLDTYWLGQTEFGTDRVNGAVEQLCSSNPSLGQQALASIVNVAETARIQGIDLYGEQEGRIVAGHEFLARYLNQAPPTSWIKYDPQSYTRSLEVGPWLCGGSPLALREDSTWEIVYNHYVYRIGHAMPQTAATLARVRAYATPGQAQPMAWETLTHAARATLP